MITLKNSRHVQTTRNIKRFRSCRANTGFSLANLDDERIYRESIALIDRILQHSWLAQLWKKHMARCRLMKVFYFQ
jgi:hypothetical protein